MSIGLNKMTELLAKQYQKSVLAEFQKQNAVLKTIADNARRFDRLSHVEEIPVDPARVKAQRNFLRRWHTLIALGMAEGFISEYEPETYCAYELETTKRDKIFDETVEEWRERLRVENIDSPYVTFPVRTVRREDS